MADAADSLPPEFAELLDDIRTERIGNGEDPQSPLFEAVVQLTAQSRSLDYDRWYERQLQRSGAPKKEERSAALRLQDVADDGRLDVRDLVPGDNPPDLVGQDSDGEVCIELKRLVFGSDAQDVIRTNAWLEPVHEVMVDLGQLLPGGDLCYLPLPGGRLHPAALRGETDAAASRLQATTGGLRETPMPLAKPVLLLQWIPRWKQEQCWVSRQSVVHDPGDDSETLYDLLLDRVLAIDSRYAPSDRQRWWLVLHDEGDMISEPLYEPEFRAFLDGADPIKCRCFNRVLILGDYHASIETYPLVEVPVRRR